jgi:hypothetical protein
MDRFVRRLSDGYDTVIDEEGSNVSAGEKQLITIARAFLSNRSLIASPIGGQSRSAVASHQGRRGLGDRRDRKQNIAWRVHLHRRLLGIA